MNLSELKPNPNNPRVIKDERFKKLVNSIKEFPKMMRLRPIVVDDDNMILGGNMRLRALQELNYTEIPDEWVARASDLTEEERKRFIIVDNVGFGENDLDMLANEWELEDLDNWGVEKLIIPEILDDITLPDGEKAGFQQITFTLTDEQAEEVKLAINQAKKNDFTGTGNENSNGNAIALICELYNGNQG